MVSLQSLQVVHLLKRQLSGSQLALAKERVSELGADRFSFDSCQRLVWVSDRPILSEKSGFELPWQSFSAESAYEFLLRVATGLESEIVGETDVFGQLKEAWRLGGGVSSRLRAELQPWMQRIFEDSKEIRSRFLEHLGGASYGSLARKLLRREGLKGPTLLLGAGQISQAVAPFLGGELAPLSLWNRSEEKLAPFAETLRSQGVTDLRIVRAGELERAWRSASIVVVGIPLSQDSEPQTQGLRWSKQGKGAIVHLGALREQAGEWGELPRFFCLDDLFALQQSMEQARVSQIRSARKECIERSKLRALGGSISIAHGWEDLAVFA